MVGIDPVLAKGDLESGRIAQRREWGVSATLLAYMRENWKHRKRMDRPARLSFKIEPQPFALRPSVFPAVG
jgi:hypothetical protein